MPHSITAVIENTTAIVKLLFLFFNAPMITKRQLLEKYGTETKVGQVFNPPISQAAVNKWPMDGPIPLTRELQLRYEIDPKTWGKKKAKARARA